MELLPHNKELCDKIIKKLKTHHDICIVQGTGGGKSFILMYLITTIFKHSKIAVVTPTIDIQDGIKNYKQFEEVEDKVTFFTNNYFSDKEKINYIAENYDVVVVDEVHHIGSDLYGVGLRTLKDIMVGNGKYFLGLTATPIRSSDKVDVKEFFSTSVTGYSTFEFIQMGLMPPIEYLICEKETLDRAVKEEYKEVIDYESSMDLLEDIIKDNHRNKWLCYFGSVKDLKAHRKLIKELFPNHRYIEIYSGSEETSEVFSTIKDDEKVVISSVSKLLEGVHLKGMEGILLFRKVTSLNVFEQILGRLLTINSDTSPVFVDCTSCASKMLAKLLDIQNSSDSLPTNEVNAKDIIKVSLCNKKYFDISMILMELGTTVFRFRYVEYPSYSDACRAFNVKPKRAFGVIERYGMSKVEALEYVIKSDAEKEVTVYGTPYPNLKAACDAYNIPTHYVYNKAKRDDISKVDALIYFIENGLEEKFPFNGVEYNSLKECLELNGLKYSGYARYMNIHKDEFIGKTQQEKVAFYINYRQSKLFPFNGKVYSSVRECLDSYDLAKTVISDYRRYHNGAKDMSDQDIIQYILDKRENSTFYFQGVEYNSETECIRRLNIVSKYRTYKRLYGDKFETPQELIAFILEDIAPKPFMYNGKTFPSEKDCFIYYGIPIEIKSVENYMEKHEECKDMSDDEVITHLIKLEENREPFTFEGVTYGSRTRCLNKFEVPIHLIIAKRSKVKELKGKSDQIVLSYILEERKSRLFNFRGKHFPTRTECLRQYDFNTASFARYKRQHKEECEGLTDQEIIELMIENRGRRNK